MASILLRDLRFPGDPSLKDLQVEDGRVAFIRPSDPVRKLQVDAEVKLDGRVVLPPFVNAHCHVDKTSFGAAPQQVSSRSVREIVANESKGRFARGVPNRTRMRGLLRAMALSGTTLVRSHTDIDLQLELRSVEMMLDLSANSRHWIEVEQVAFPQAGLTGSRRVQELMEESLRLGVEVVGGLDPATFDNDPVRHLDIVFSLAERFGKKVDIHLHDSGSLGLWEMELIAARTKALSLGGRVTISHAFALGDGPAELVRRTSALLGAAGVAIHFAGNFNDPVPPIGLLMDDGVGVALGTDGVQDAWSPFGNGSMLERCAVVAQRIGAVDTHGLQLVVDLATTLGAETLGRGTWKVQPGTQANFVVLDAIDFDRAIAQPSAPYLVFKGGAPIEVPA